MPLRRTGPARRSTRDLIARGRTFTGPFSDNWGVTDSSDGGPVVGGCGGSPVLDVDSSLSLAAGSSVPGSASRLAMDSTDGVASSTYHVIWQRC